MSISTATLWLVIAGLAFGSWLLRFSFLGIIGNKELPEWVKRHLRYTLVAVMPGIIAPLVFMPRATDGGGRSVGASAKLSGGGCESASVSGRGSARGKI